MNLDEQERTAYIAGGAAQAALFGSLIDATQNINEAQETLLNVQEEIEFLRQVLQNLVEACEEGDPEEIANEVIRARQAL
jgi:hypothetical protein